MRKLFKKYLLTLPEHAHILNTPWVELPVLYFVNFFEEQSMYGGQLDIEAVQRSTRLMHALTDEVSETDSNLEKK